MPSPNDAFSKPLIAERVRFSDADRARITRCRRVHNRLGFAYQMGFLKLTDRLPKQQPLEVARDLLAYVARKIGQDAADLEGYAQRQPTVSAHARQVREHLGYCPFGSAEQADLERFLEREVEHLEQTAALVAKAKEHLRSEKVLLPARSALRRSAEHAREAFRSRLFERVARLLPAECFCLYMSHLDGACFEAFLGELRKAYPEDEIVLVVDGAGSHLSKKVSWPEGIEAMRLPAYSPEFNPAERWFEELRARLSNRVFETVEAIEEALTEALRPFWRAPEKLARLTGYGWWVESIGAITTS